MMRSVATEHAPIAIGGSRKSHRWCYLREVMAAAATAAPKHHIDNAWLTEADRILEEINLSITTSVRYNFCMAR